MFRSFFGSQSSKNKISFELEYNFIFQNRAEKIYNFIFWGKRSFWFQKQGHGETHEQRFSVDFWDKQILRGGAVWLQLLLLLALPASKAQVSFRKAHYPVS